MKKFFSLISIFCISLILVACNKQHYTVEINGDGSSRMIIRVTVDKDSYESLQNYTKIKDDKVNINPLFQKDSDKFKKEGFEIERIDDEIDIGFKASKDYTSSIDFNRDMKNLYDKKIISSNFKMTAVKSFYKKTFKLDGILKYTEDEDLVEIMKEAKEKGIKKGIDTDKMTTELTVIMPGKIYQGKNSFSTGYNKNPEKINVSSVLYNSKLQKIGILAIVLVIFIISFKLFNSYIARDRKVKRDKKSNAGILKNTNRTNRNEKKRQKKMMKELESKKNEKKNKKRFFIKKR